MRKLSRVHKSNNFRLVLILLICLWCSHHTWRTEYSKSIGSLLDIIEAYGLTLNGLEYSNLKHTWSWCVLLVFLSQPLVNMLCLPAAVWGVKNGSAGERKKCTQNRIWKTCILFSRAVSLPHKQIIKAPMNTVHIQNWHAKHVAYFLNDWYLEGGGNKTLSKIGFLNKFHV